MLEKKSPENKSVWYTSKINRMSIFLIFGLVISFSFIFKSKTYLANESYEDKHFMVYYRAWRDKTMKGVNTDLPDENWITMSDIPYGIDIVNVFSYVPKGQEELAQPFFDKLKSSYAPELHSRGIRLVRGIDYSELLKISYTGLTPTEAEYDQYAKELLEKLVDDIGIDGLDIDMETQPSPEEIVLSNGVIKALSKYIGPKSGTGRPFLYDTNAEYLAPLKDVSDCFDFLAYQQYGSDDKRTARASASYADVLGSTGFVPGLSFPEELDNNRWYDAIEPYTESNMYKVARYSHENNLGGMFLYALDRDGRTYDSDDLNHVKPSNLLWTKTAIVESKGIPLKDLKTYAKHFLKRISYYNTDNLLDVETAVEKSETLYEVNKAILGEDYGKGISSTYDPLLEQSLMVIDLTELYDLLDQADQSLVAKEQYTPETVQNLSDVRSEVAEKLAGKQYTMEEGVEWKSQLQQAIENLKEKEEEVKKMKSVFSIDAGRKYFSLEQMKGIVNKAYLNGYSDVQILLGNDALRLLLDDMSLNVNGKKYASDEVKQAIQAGNNTYYNDPNGNALTQGDMDELLGYAKERGINIIPVINSPGHMDAILVAMEQLGIKNPAVNQSKRTVDIGNQEAVAFTKELIKKYVTYFAKSSTIFNFGGDEYANDVDTGGWQKLQDSGLYKEFINYVNDLAKIIKEAGMEPMIFNDGIYYNSDDTFGIFDKDIIISYWTAGWGGYNVAKSEYFVKKGHKILNTNDAWYWVIGNLDSGIYRFDDALSAIENKKFTDVPVGTKIPIIGSMQCVWSDNPSQDHDFERIYQLMETFSTNYSGYMNLPADYSKVDSAVKNIPENLQIYTEESVKKLQGALGNVIYGLRADEQEKVNTFSSVIEQAITDLVEKPIEKPIEKPKDEELKTDENKVTEIRPSAEKSDKSAKKSREKKLPQTGEQRGAKMIMIGIGLVLLVGIGFLLNKRKKYNDFK